MLPLAPRGCLARSAGFGKIFNKLLQFIARLQIKCPHAWLQGPAALPKMDKRKFLFVPLSGLIGDIAWQVLKEGHDVRYYIEAEKERDIADGFVPKSKDWEKDAKWSDIIVFDDTLGQGAKGQALRASGK